MDAEISSPVALPGIERPESAPLKTTPLETVPLDTAPTRRERFTVAAMITAGLGYILWLYRDMWFFGDEWNFIVTRRDLWARGEYLETLFRPHTDHWSTVPVIAYSALLRLFHLRSYIPFLIFLLILHGITAFLLHELLRRIGVGRLASIGGTLLFTLFGAGAENLSWAFQIGIVGSIGLGIGQLLAITSERPNMKRHVGPTAAVVNIMTSGIAAPMLLAVTVVLVLQRRYRELIYNVGLPLVLYVLWYATYGHKGAAYDNRPGLFASYVENGVFSTLEATTRLRSAGALLFILLVIAATRWWEHRARQALPIACVVSGVGMFMIFAIRRASLGAEQAAQSRYVYCAGAMLIGPLLLMIATLAREHRTAKVVTAAVLALAVAGNASNLNAWAVMRIKEVEHTRESILSVASIPTLAKLDPGVAPDPRFSPDLLIRSLRGLVKTGYLPLHNRVSTQFSVDKEAEVAIRLALNDASPSPVLLPDERLNVKNRCARIVGVDGDDFTATIAQTGVVSFVSSQSGLVQLRFVLDGFTSAEVGFAAEANVPLLLNVATNRGKVLVDLPNGADRVCGLQ